MKFLLLLIFLFIPNIYAENDALLCTYTTSNDNSITFGYYIDENKAYITNFRVNDENYSYYNKVEVKSDELACPVINEVKFQGYDKLCYFVTASQEDFEKLPDENGVIYESTGSAVLGDYPLGQVDNDNSNSASNDSKFNYTHYESAEISGSINSEIREQMTKNIKAYLYGYCTNKERKAIFYYFNENSIDENIDFSRNDLFKIDDEYITLSSNCANDAKNLHASVLKLRLMLSDYVDDDGDVNTINYLSLMGSYYSGFGALTTFSVSVNISDDPCKAISKDVRNILNNFFNTFRLIAVILTIFFVYLDGMKQLAKKDDSETKKWITSSIKRFIILILCLLLPFLVNLVLDLVDNYIGSSYVSVNGECVKAITGG